MSENLIASTASKARRLTDEEIHEIEHEMELYPDKRAVGLEALKIVQKHQGWVSDESMLAISKFLEIPVSDLESVATFFNLVYRQPVGENVILFCNSVSCWVMGCESMRSHINEELGIDFGQTSEDGKFTFSELLTVNSSWSLKIAIMVSPLVTPVPLEPSLTYINANTAL